MIPCPQFLGNQPTVTFVAADNTNGTTLAGTLASYGVQAGDLLVIMSQNATTPTVTSGGTWTLAGTVNGAEGKVYWYIAKIADLPGNITCTGGGGYQFAAYRGPGSLVWESANTGTGANLTVTGFTRVGLVLGLFSVTYLNGNISQTPAMSTPATWTVRDNHNYGSDRGKLFDRLEPANTAYVNGTNCVAANGTGSSLGAAVMSLRY